MKFIYSVMLMTLLLVCSQHTIAQDKIIKGSNTRLGPISGGDEDPTGIPILPCHCFYRSDFGQFEYSLQNSESPELKWFQGQEKAMKKELEQRLNQRFNTFEDAQLEFFKGFSPSSLIGHYENQVENYINTNFNYSTTAIKNAQADYRTLETWQQERSNIQNGRPREHYFGDLKYNNNRIEDITNFFSLNSFINAERNKFNHEKNKRTNRLTWNNKLKSAKENKTFRTFIANQFISFYNRLGYRDAIRVMSVYMISDYSNSSSVVLPPSHFFNDNIWWPDNQDLTSNMIGVTSNQPAGNVGITDTSNISGEAAIFRYAANSMGGNIRNFLFESQRSGLRSSTKGYLKSNKYSSGSLNSVSDAIDGYLNNELRNYMVSSNFVQGGGSSINLPHVGVDLAYKFTYNTQGENRGLRVLSHFYYDLYNLDTNHFHLEGHRIRLALIFSGSGLDLSKVSNEDLGRLFNFSTVYPYGLFNFNFFLEYSINVAGILNSHNISLQNLLLNPDLVTLFGDISQAYKLGKIDYSDLSRILNYLENEELSIKTIEYVKNLIYLKETLGTYFPPSCKSFEYVQNLENTQTAGIQNLSFRIRYRDPLGEIHLSDIEFTQPLYFTIPRFHNEFGNLTTGIGKERSAKALATAHARATAYFLATGANESQLRGILLEYIKDEFRNGSYMTGGVVDLIPPLGSPQITIKEYIFTSWFTDNCN